MTYRATPALLLAIGLSTLPLRADEPTGPPTLPGVSEPKVLLLTSGSIVEGLVTPSTGGYMVRKPNGSMLVPYRQVQLEGNDLHDVYLKQRESMPVRTANAHLQLAQWCLGYQLDKQARDELRDALILEPRRDDIRQVLVRLEAKLSPEPKNRPVPPPASPIRTAETGSDTEFTPPQARSLSGLPRDVAADFVRQVQPILVRKCATAGCHGDTSDSGFQLSPVGFSRGNHRVIAERNLAAVLNFISTQSPDQSPLLAVLGQNHAGRGDALLSGPGGAVQMAALTDWVHAVAEAEAAANPPAATSQHTTEAPPEQTPSGNASVKTMIPPPAHRNVAATPKVLPAREAEEAFFAEILREKAADAFDPEEFNRQARSPGP